jgi:hypothetical protein
MREKQQRWIQKVTVEDRRNNRGSEKQLIETEKATERDGRSN